MGDLVVDGVILLKLILEKMGVKVKTGLSCFSLMFMTTYEHDNRI
jgi:hypothetical protein